MAYNIVGSVCAFFSNPLAAPDSAPRAAPWSNLAESMSITPVDDGSHESLINIVHHLGANLSLRGPLAPVLDQACEQLGVERSGDLRSRARRCLEVIGGDVLPAPPEARAVLVKPDQILCDVCGADCTAGGWLTRQGQDVCADCYRKKPAGTEFAWPQKQGKAAGPPVITAQPRAERSKRTEPYTAKEIEGCYLEAKNCCCIVPIPTVGLRCMRRATDEQIVGCSCLNNPPCFVSKFHYVRRREEADFPKNVWRTMEDKEGTFGNQVCGQTLEVVNQDCYLEKGWIIQGCAVRCCPYALYPDTCPIPEL